MKVGLIICILTLSITSVLSQVAKDTSEIVVDLSVVISEATPEIERGPIDKIFGVYGHFDKDYKRQKRLNSKSKYTRLKHRKSGKMAIMKSSVYYQHSKNQTSPMEKDFLLPPIYDGFDFKKSGIGIGKIDEEKYILSNKFQRLLDSPILRYEIEKSERSDVTYVTVKTSTGRSVFTANGQLIVAETMVGGTLFRNDYLLLSRGDSLFVFDESGKLAIPPLYSENDHYMSLHGVITLVNNRKQSTYIDVDAGGDTIAIAQKGIYHRSDHTAIKNGDYWQIIDRKGIPIQTPFEEIIKVSFYNQHRAALIVRENPEFDPDARETENKFLYTFMDVTTGKFGHIRLNKDEFRHYRLYSGQHFLTRGNSWLKVEVSEVSPNAAVGALDQVRYKGYVSLEGKFYPKKGKFHDVSFGRIPGQKEESPRFLRVTSAIDDYGLQLRYGVTDLEGNVIVAANYLEVQMTRQGIRVRSEEGYGLFDLTGKALIPAKYKQSEYYKEIRKLN